MSTHAIYATTYLQFIEKIDTFLFSIKSFKPIFFFLSLLICNLGLSDISARSLCLSRWQPRKSIKTVAELNADWSTTLIMLNLSKAFHNHMHGFKCENGIVQFSNLLWEKRRIYASIFLFLCIQRENWLMILHETLYGNASYYAFSGRKCEVHNNQGRALSLISILKIKLGSWKSDNTKS